MNRELLEKPFGKEQIKQRKGNFGDMIDYVETHSVIQRLNDAFEGQWYSRRKREKNNDLSFLILNSLIY
jgi:recombination DNA repair RAD52 pathway protein